MPVRGSPAAAVPQGWSRESIAEFAHRPRHHVAQSLLPTARARGAGGGPAGRRRHRGAIGMLVIVVLVLGAVVGVTLAWTQHVALDRAVTQVERLATEVVAPVLDDDVIAGDRQAIAQLDQILAGQLDDEVARIKVWDASGRIVYSDEPKLIGRTFDLPEIAPQILADEAARIEVDELGRAENVFEADGVSLIEVYAMARTPAGQPVIVEAYFLHEDITARAVALAKSSLPALIMVTLFALIGWTMIVKRP